MHVLHLLWGKTDRTSSEGAAWHPLLFHLIDVHAACAALLDGRVPGGVRARLADALGVSSVQAARWIPFLVALHDLGKATPSFQCQWRPGRDRLRAAGLRASHRCRPHPHGVLSAATLERLLPSQLGLDQRVAEAVGRAVGAHHGEFPTDLDLTAVDPALLGDSAWDAVRRALVDIVAEHSGVRGMEPPRGGLANDPGAMVSLAGLTTLADWVGSMEMFFPFEPAQTSVTTYASLARDRAERALEATGWRARAATGPATSFADRFSFPPRSLQAAAERIVATLRPPCLLVVEAPMGEGKTEVALHAAETLNRASGASGFFIGLPTQATSNQMLRRVLRFLETAPHADLTNLHLTHGEAALVATYRDLRLRAIHDDGGPPECSVVADEWFARPKRALLSPHAVGTIDQVLLGVLRVRHAFLRQFGLAGKVVVLDEVHAYDAYTSELIERLMTWLAATGTSVVLLSATLPTARLRSLVAAFSGTAAAVPDAGYPRITWAAGASVGSETVAPRAPTVSIELRWEPDDPARIARHLVDAVRDGGCVAWICNSVGRAQAAFVAIRTLVASEPDESAWRLVLLHSRMRARTRQERETLLGRLMGPHGDERPERAIVVGTQVLEQSLDVDFDLMVSDIAPVDLVLQRVGRLHRHARPRPQHLARPSLWLVCAYAEADPSLPDLDRVARVYERGVMLRTWIKLSARDHLRVPDEIAPLVESVYTDGPGPETDAQPRVRALVDEALRSAAEQRSINRGRATVRAWPRPDDPDGPLRDLSSPLDDDEGSEAPDTLRALTRLGAPSVSVVCAEERCDGTFVDGAPVPVDSAPQGPDVRRLVENAMPVSHRGIVPVLLRTPVPPRWMRSPHLRRRRIVAFRAGLARVGGWVVRDDAALGLVVEKETEG